MPSMVPFRFASMIHPGWAASALGHEPLRIRKGAAGHAGGDDHELTLWERRLRERERPVRRSRHADVATIIASQAHGVAPPVCQPGHVKLGVGSMMTVDVLPRADRAGPTATATATPTSIATASNVGPRRRLNLDSNIAPPFARCMGVNARQCKAVKGMLPNYSQGHPFAPCRGLRAPGVGKTTTRVGRIAHPFAGPATSDKSLVYCRPASRCAQGVEL